MSSGSSSTSPAQAPSVADLQAEIAAARDELVATIAALKAATTPASLAKRGGRAVSGFFTDEFGGIRPDRVALVGAVVVGFIAIKLIRRGRR